MTTSDDTTKVCSKCGEEKPRAEFSKRSTAKDGLQSACKLCFSEMHRSWRLRNPDKERERQQAWLVNNRERRNEYEKRYAEEHRDETQARGRAWYIENREYKLKRNAEWYEQHPEARKAKDKKRYWSNPERERARSADYKARNKPRIKVRCQLWAKRNPDKVRLYARNRRARLAQAEGTHTADDIKLQYRAQNGKCWWCGAELNEIYHADHLIPLVRGGTNWPNNIVCSCAFCNTSKKDKLPHEWKGRLF